MIFRRAFFLMTLAAGLSAVGCTDEDESDDNGGSIVRTHQPTGDSIPDSFSNTATSFAAFSSKTAVVDTDLIGATTVALGLAAAPEAGFRLMEEAPAAPETNVDLATFMTDVALNADCTPYFTFIGGRLKSLLSALSYFKTATASMGTSGDISGLATIYTIENLNAESGSKYIFNMRMTPIAGAVNPLAKLGVLTIAGGSTATELALRFGVASKFDTEQLKSEITTGYDAFANTETKLLQLGLRYNVSLQSGNGEPVGIKLKTDVALQGGEAPSLTATMDFDGTDADGNTVPGNIKYHLARTGADTFTLAWSGGYINKNVEQTLQITRTATACTVTAID